MTLSPQDAKIKNCIPLFKAMTNTTAAFIVGQCLFKLHNYQSRFPSFILDSEFISCLNVFFVDVDYTTIAFESPLNFPARPSYFGSPESPLYDKGIILPVPQQRVCKFMLIMGHWLTKEEREQTRYHIPNNKKTDWHKKQENREGQNNSRE